MVLKRRELDNGYVLSRGRFRDNPMLVCRTGLGEERAKGIADEIIHEHPVSAIVPARMASAIPTSPRVGDLAFCLRPMLHRSSEDIIHQLSVEVDRRLLELGVRTATSAGVPHVIGDWLTLAPLRPVPVNRELAGDVGNVAHPTRLPNLLRLEEAVRVSCPALSCFFGAFLAEWEQHPLSSRIADQR